MIEDVSDEEDTGQDDLPKDKRKGKFEMGATEVFNIPINSNNTENFKYSLKIVIFSSC